MTQQEIPGTSLSRLMSPRGIAIVGASEERRRPGGQPVHALKEYGYRGGIYPVNPRHAAIDGITCYPAVGAVPKPCDVALIALPAAAVPAAIEQCGAAGIPFAIVLSAGFGETGERGLQAELEAAIRRSGVRVVGPNCVGLLNLADNVYAGFGAGFRNPHLKRGPVAMVTQSGGFGYSVVAFAEHEGIGFNAMVSTGNEVDLTSLDMIAHLLECDEVEVIVCYMEGVRDGRRLRAIGARALELGKPVVVWKVGNSVRGAQAALSHTANLTARYELYQAAFRAGGFVEIGDMYDLVDVVAAFRGRRLPAGRRIGVLTTSGGAGVLLADRCEERGLELPSLGAQAVAELRALVPGFAALENPVDLSAALAQNPDKFNAATRMLLGDPAIDLAIVRSFPGADVVAWATGLARLAGESGKPVLVSLSGLALSSPEAQRTLDEHAIACYATPGRAVVAAAALADFAERQRRWKCGAAPRTAERKALPLDGRSMIGERDAKACFERYGIPVVREHAIALTAMDDTSCWPAVFPCAVKIDSPDIAHKTEAGGVVTGVADIDALHAAIRQVVDNARAFKPDARIDGVLVQEMADGVEMIAGAVNDPVFGPYVVLGLGGIHAELVRDKTLRYAPFDARTAHEMIGELRCADVLRGYRGGAHYDIDALADAVSRLSWLVSDHAERIAEIDINPLFVRAAGRGVLAADGLIALREN